MATLDPKGAERNFPDLNPSNHNITSPKTRTYNCIAYAVGENKRWWWPEQSKNSFWPVPKIKSVQSFISAFATKGFTECDTEAHEPGYEKIALYCNRDGAPTHAAKQLDEKWWSSKLGEHEDISHEMDALDGPEYGTITRFFKRKIETPEKDS